MKLKPFDKYKENMTRPALFAIVEENVLQDIEVMSPAWLEVAEQVLSHYGVVNKFSRLAFFKYATWRKGKRRHLKKKDARYGSLKTHFNYAQVSMNPQAYLARGLGKCGNGFAMPWTALPYLPNTSTIRFPEEEECVEMEQPDLITVKARSKDVSAAVIIMQAEKCLEDETFKGTFADALVWTLDWHGVLMKDRVNLLSSIEMRLRKMRKKKLLAALAYERKYNRFAGIMETIEEDWKRKGIYREESATLQHGNEDEGLPF